MSKSNPYEHYKEQALNSLAPGEILVKLFDELLKQCRIATIGIEAKDYGKVNDSLTKMQTILSTLQMALDMNFPISKNLNDLYMFLSQQMLKANINKDVKIIEECVPLFRELRDSFEQAEKMSRIQRAGGSL